MCHSKLGKQKWPFRGRLGDASCLERCALGLFLVSPVSPSLGWSIRKVRNWQEIQRGESNQVTQQQFDTFRPAVCAILLLAMVWWTDCVKWCDINLHCPASFSYPSDVCSQPFNLPYIPTANYMSERLLKVCHNDDDLLLYPPPIHTSWFYLAADGAGSQADW